jgi:copper chaperone CopZ
MSEKYQEKPNSAFVVHRSLPVPGVHDQGNVQTIHDCLGGLDGVQEVDVDSARKRVRVVYDAAQVGFEAIEKVLIDAGYPLADNWWVRFKSGWYRYLDENARANAQSKGGACCSNPSDIYAKRHK